MNQMAQAGPAMPTAQTLEDVVARGDLSKLTPEQRVVHYYKVCDTLKLNPETQPFQYITLSGKLVLYAKRDATDQLRKINGINLTIVGRNVTEGLLTVHVKATDKTGRTDEDFGVVAIAGLRGEAAANAVMKCITKAKRRVTLSISGLGFSDESEVEELGERVPMTLGAAAAPQLNRASEAEQIAAAGDEQVAPPYPIPFEVGENDNIANVWSNWAIKLMGYIRNAQQTHDITTWLGANNDQLGALERYDAEKYQRLMRMIEHQIAIRNERAPGSGIGPDEPR